MKMCKLVCGLVSILVMTGCDESRQDNKPPVSANATAVSDLKIVRWGPQATTVGKVFNVQPNGLSAIWFQMSGSVNPEYPLELWMGNSKLADIRLNSDMGGASIVPNELINKASELPLYLIDPQSKNRFDIGVFKVLPATKS